MQRRLLGVGAKLKIAFGALAALTVVVVVIGLLAGQRISEALRSAAEVRAPASLTSAQAQASLMHMQLHVRGYLVLGDPDDIAQFHEHRRAFEGKLAELKALAGSEGNDGRQVEQVMLAYEQWLPLPLRLFELHNNQPYGERQALRLYRTEAAPWAQRVLQLLEALTSQQQAALQADLDRARDRLGSVDVPAILGGVVAILLALALASMSHRRIIGRLQRLTKTAEQLAAGDLSARAAVESDDEIGTLAQLINTRLRQEDLQQLMASVSDALWSADVGPAGEFSYRFYSPVVERVAGRPADYFRASPERWLDAIHVDDRPAVTASRERISSGATDREELQYRVVRPDGTLRWLRDSVRAVRFDGGRTVLNGVISDVTEQHDAEDELRRLEYQLRQAQRLEAMGTLAGGIAHDFNNVLGAILGYGEMALRDAPAGSRLRRDLDSILQAGERGRAIVDRIRAFSRSGTGKRIPVHVEAVVRAAIERLAAQLPDGITIDAQLHAGRAAILGDATQVHQVLMNLATNAVQAMPTGGTLRVSLAIVSSEAPLIATTGTIKAGEYIALAVGDNGTGIAKDVIERIFDPFFTTKEVGVGSGLGLSFVHGIVSDVGGAVDVQSTPGDGSVFTVYLPRAGDLSEDEERAEEEPPHGQQQNVLLVDDEEPLLRLAAESLAERGYLPVAFTSSVAALQAFRAQPQRFGAVITDERMPGMSGSTLLREIRRMRPTIPTLLVTGNVGDDVVAHAKDAGADEVLRKPLAMRELAAALARVLAR